MICLVVTAEFVRAESSNQWNMTYGLHGSGWCVIQTRDGGYAIAGNSGDQILFLKVNSSGVVQWEKTYGEGTAYSIIETSDGGYALAGTGDSLNFVKTDSEGNLEWSKHYSKSDVPFHVQSLIQTSDGGYALTGWISSTFRSPWWDWTIKTNSNGDIQWNKTFGETDEEDSGSSVQQTTDGGYILTGYKSSLAIARDVWLIKTDHNGNEQWNKTFGGSYIDVGCSIQQTNDGGYIIAGITSSYGTGIEDIWLIKTSSDGTTSFKITNLTSNWNFISLPFNQTIGKINIIIHQLNNNYTWSEAVLNSYISDFIFDWNRSSQSYTFATARRPITINR